LAFPSNETNNFVMLPSLIAPSEFTWTILYECVKCINGFVRLVAALIGLGGIIGGWFLRRSKQNNKQIEEIDTSFNPYPIELSTAMNKYHYLLLLQRK
jgi:hypothetical protein